jgi:hypothetical protein
MSVGLWSTKIDKFEQLNSAKSVSSLKQYIA